jgi:hypothetical protein
MKKMYFKNNGLSLRQFNLRCKNILNCAKRDLNVLNSYGVTHELLTDFEQKLAVLNQISTYPLDAASRKNLTLERNRLKKIIVAEVKMLQKQLFFAFEKGTSGYDVLFSKNLSGAALDKFASSILEFAEILKQNAQSLVQYHLTAEKIAQVEDLIGQFMSSYEALSGVHHTFKESAAERSAQRQEINRTLLYISGIGKTYWQLQGNPVLSKEYNISRVSKIP